ncbi:hypothetical protein, partial [Vibrio cholerae]|uniref:hypothetical protein n=1 Tax=Vibrio cholerae TaxID=666 RepID=UPI001C11808C
QGTFNEIIQNYTIYVPPKGFSRLIIWLQTYKNPLNYGQQTVVILLSALTGQGGEQDGCAGNQFDRCFHGV